MRNWILALVLAMTLTGAARGQAWQYQWRTGESLTYRISHETNVTQVVAGTRTETSSKLQLVKRWDVLEVDEAGVATVQMSLVSMRNEQKRPDGEVLLFDSGDADKSTPGLREQMSQFIGKPLAVLRVDRSGQVVEARQGPAGRYEAEPPFTLVLPGRAVAPGEGWEREYTLTLLPPQGTGEEYQAKQSYQVTKVEAGLATLTLRTAISNLPESQLDQVPLLQKQPGGEVVFDVAHGRLQRARLEISRELQNQQGSGSSYRFESTYTEEYVGTREGDREQFASP